MAEPTKEQTEQLISVLQKLIEDGQQIASNIEFNHKALLLAAKHSGSKLPEVAEKTYQTSLKVLQQYELLGEKMQTFIGSSKLLHLN